LKYPIVTDATKYKIWRSLPALKRRAKLMPTLRDGEPLLIADFFSWHYRLR
jgi:hypothetical protein